MLSKVTGFVCSKGGPLKSITDAIFACDKCGKESSIGDMVSKEVTDDFYCPRCDGVMDTRAEKEITIGEKWENIYKCDLQAIVAQLELCGFSCDAGLLENNVAFQELKRIASDKHNVAACLATVFHNLELSKSIAFVTSHDVSFHILDDRAIMVTVEYCTVPSDSIVKSLDIDKYPDRMTQVNK